MPKVFSKADLKNLSLQLLELHKALLNFEQKDYEENFGKVGSPNNLLDLLMNNPHFAWLRTLSQLIVGIDELVDNQEPASQKQIDDLISYTQILLNPVAKPGNSDNSHAGKFTKRYLTALQKDPHVALAHGRVVQLLK